MDKMTPIFYKMNMCPKEGEDQTPAVYLICTEASPKEILADANRGKGDHNVMGKLVVVSPVNKLDACGYDDSRQHHDDSGKHHKGKDAADCHPHPDLYCCEESHHHHHMKHPHERGNYHDGHHKHHGEHGHHGKDHHQHHGGECGHHDKSSDHHQHHGRDHDHHHGGECGHHDKDHGHHNRDHHDHHKDKDHHRNRSREKETCDKRRSCSGSSGRSYSHRRERSHDRNKPGTDCHADSEKPKNKNKGRSKKHCRDNSRELRAGKLYIGCDCEKRNGLQDDCQRSLCQGSPECLTIPPTCIPSEFSNGKHLTKLRDEAERKIRERKRKPVALT